MRNVAIIAHVDHGKTTLVDRLLKLAGEAFAGERVMDSNKLEQERGITILAKTTSVQWTHPSGQEYHINIVDTPGHADFGGEVERTLSMVDGVVLVVDASEGPQIQTKFVLSKALAQGLRPIVVLNKVDRATARIREVENEIFDLFVSLGASDAQLDFPILYASAKEGWAVRDPDHPRGDMSPVLEAVVAHVPAPRVDAEAPAAMLVSMLDHDKIFGRILTGRIYAGTFRIGARLIGLTVAGERAEESKVLKMFARRGMERIYVDEAGAGDIISIAGFSKTTVTDTLCDPAVAAPIAAAPIDPPTLSICIGPNDSPLSGKEGKQLTSAMIRERLQKEAESNIAIALSEGPDRDTLEVAGRGELQLGILLENLRREGFEVTLGSPSCETGVSPPKVVFRTGEGGERQEPIEEVHMEVPDEVAGLMIEAMNLRKGEMKDMKPLGNGRTRMEFEVPSRGLIGFQSLFNTMTGGDGVCNRAFARYEAFRGSMDRVRKGVLISMDEGVATTYALDMLQPRGVLFIGPQAKVYSGMIIGEHSRENDLEVNPTKEKKLTNVRSVGHEDMVRLTPPRQISLEYAIGYCNEDEMIEITPQSIRLRKRHLDPNKRKALERARAAQSS
eukprot:tig00020614_g12138.t1